MPFRVRRAAAVATGGLFLCLAAGARSADDNAKGPLSPDYLQLDYSHVDRDNASRRPDGTRVLASIGIGSHFAVKGRYAEQRTRTVDFLETGIGIQAHVRPVESLLLYTEIGPGRVRNPDVRGSETDFTRYAVGSRHRFAEVFEWYLEGEHWSRTDALGRDGRARLGIRYYAAPWFSTGLEVSHTETQQAWTAGIRFGF